MGRKISKERILELERQKTNKDKLSRVKRKRIKREEKQKKWRQNLKSRGGFVRKKAKRWGEPCGHTECKMWEDGECQYSERDKKGCYLDLKEEN